VLVLETIEEVLQEQVRIVSVSEHFVAPQRSASPAPFPTHTYPPRHLASFGMWAQPRWLTCRACSGPCSPSS